MVVVDAGGVKRPEFEDSTREAVIARGNNCTALLNAVSELLRKSSKLDKNYQTNWKDFMKASKMLKYGRKMEILQGVYARLSRTGANFALPCVVKEVVQVAPTPIYYPSMIDEAEEPKREDVIRERVSSRGQIGKTKAGWQKPDWFEEAKREKARRVRASREMAQEKANINVQVDKTKEMAEQKATQKAFSQLLMQATKKSAFQVSSQAHEASTNSGLVNRTNGSKFQIAGHEGEQFEQESIGTSDAVERLAALEQMLNDWFAAPV
ncbi:MAG: hypothetical protein C0464_03760 [Cyanobacteria bacterium DS2.008]|nr:hypothetical protein [Cyanobacteria bacterium DS2.008]